MNMLGFFMVFLIDFYGSLERKADLMDRVKTAVITTVLIRKRKLALVNLTTSALTLRTLAPYTEN